MKKILLSIIEVLLTLFLIVSLSGFLFKVFQEKQSVRKYREFYAASDEYDVRFLTYDADRASLGDMEKLRHTII